MEALCSTLRNFFHSGVFFFLHARIVCGMVRPATHQWGHNEQKGEAR
jgi:hypothetical protein